MCRRDHQRSQTGGGPRRAARSLPVTERRRPDTALRGGLSATVAMAGEQLIQFAIFLIAVRVLSPAEFGTFALAAAVIALLRLMSVAGWPEYIMSCKGSSRRPRQALFAAMASGALCALAGLLLSFAAQTAFNGPDTGALIRALSAAIFFNAIAAAQSGILNWQGRLAAAVLPPL